MDYARCFTKKIYNKSQKSIDYDSYRMHNIFLLSILAVFSNRFYLKYEILAYNHLYSESYEKAKKYFYVLDKINTFVPNFEKRREILSSLANTRHNKKYTASVYAYIH